MFHELSLEWNYEKLEPWCIVYVISVDDLHYHGIDRIKFQLSPPYLLSQLFLSGMVCRYLDVVWALYFVLFLSCSLCPHIYTVDIEICFTWMWCISVCTAAYNTERSLTLNHTLLRNVQTQLKLISFVHSFVRACIRFSCCNFFLLRNRTLLQIFADKWEYTKHIHTNWNVELNIC